MYNFYGLISRKIRREVTNRMRVYVLWFMLISFMLGGSPALAQDTIVPGEPVQGTLTEDNLTAEYTFEGQAGGLVTITLASRMFDAYLTLEDADGRVVTLNDDFGGSLDAKIESLPLPADGIYTIIVESMSAIETGDYELTLSYYNRQMIAYGDTVQGIINADTTRAQYEFEGQAGDVVLISLNSPDFDTFLHLADNSNYDLITDDDSGDGTNSLIAGYQLPQTGTYFITARPYSEPSSIQGEFTLEIYPIEVTPLAANSTIEGELNGTIDIYAIKFSAGDRIDVDVTSPDGLDTSLLLNGTNGYSLITDDDGGNDLNPEIHNWLIEEAGTFNLLIQAVDRAARGSYALTVHVEEPEPLACDSTQALNYTPKRSNLVFNIEAEADERLIFVLTSEDANTSSLYIRALQDGVIIPANTNESNENRVRIVFTPESDGEVRLLVSDYNGLIENFTMELTCR
jgi:hypothetical protein